MKNLLLLFLVSIFIISCKKKDETNNSNPTLNDQLSDSQIKSIEAAGIDTVSTFNDALFPDGSKMSNWNLNNDSGHIYAFGRVLSASDKKSLFIDRFTKAGFILKTRSNYNFPSQNGIAYVLNAKSFIIPSNYPGATCQQKLNGLDCSGMIYQMAIASNLNIPAGGTIDYVKPSIWNTAFDNSLEFQGLQMTDLAAIPQNQIQAGDIIVAPSVHIGLVFNNGNSLSILNSLGRSSYPCTKNSDNFHGPVISKNLASWLQTSFGSDYHVLRVIQNGTPGLTTTLGAITQTSAESGGNITNQGGSPVTSRGVCWSTTKNPTTANNKTSDGTGTGTFISSIIGLTSNITYHVRAYATNSSGTAYGNEVTFISAPLFDIISPANYISIPYPRFTHVIWNIIASATSYYLEVQFGKGPNYHDFNTTYDTSSPQVINSSTNSADFNGVGAQVHRFRVTAINGSINIAQSPWHYVDYPN